MKRESTLTPAPIAIIGIGCVFPKAEDLQEYWSTIKNGIDAITDIPPTHWSVNDYFDENPRVPDMTYGKKGGFISPIDFDPMEFGITPNSLEATDTSQLLGLVVAKRALEDAGYGNGKEFNRERTSVILGVTGTLELVVPLGARLGHPIWRRALRDEGADSDLTERVVKRIADSYVEWQESSFPGLLGNVVAGRIANYFNLGGTNCAVDAACASSLSALHLAGLELSSGRSDMVLTGGVDTFNDIFMFMCFSKTPALSPTGNARPFDSSCDGTVLGEGIGMIVLKRFEDAKRDGDRVYAVIRSMGTSSDGKGAAVFAPQAGGQIRAMREAYRISGIEPRTVELMEAHGTGTKVGDLTEFTSINAVFNEGGSAGAWCALGSVKSQIGHTKAAAGIAGIIKAAMSLHHKVLPPTIKVKKPFDELLAQGTPFYLNTQKRPWIGSTSHPRRAAVSSFGFGGSNFHCVLEEPSPVKLSTDWDGRVQIAALSASSPGGLEASLDDWKGGISWRELSEKSEATRKTFDLKEPCRLLMVFEREGAEPHKVVSSALVMLGKHPERKAWNTPEGAFYGSGAPSGRLAILFPGQGAQYTGMLRDLASQFPEMLAVLRDAHESFASLAPEELGAGLVNYLYPHPAFSEEEKQRQERELRDTRVAQPALGAVSYGAWKVLEHFGIKPEALGGHSYGELVSLCVAGSITPEELYHLSSLRGSLMVEGKDDLGSMLAVQLEAGLLSDIIEKERLDLVIANHNAPQQAVLSGATAEIERAAAVITAMGIRNTKLTVSAAFHSPLVADAQAPFAAGLDKVPFRCCSIPVYSNTTACLYPDDPGKTRALLVGHLAKPVRFVDEILAMYDSGVRTFLEVGPCARMTGLVKAILNGRGDFEAFSIDGSSGKRHGTGDLARALAALAAGGHAVDLTLWNPLQRNITTVDQQKKRMTIPLCGANYVNPAKKAAISEEGAPERNNGTEAPRTAAPKPESSEKAFSADSPRKQSMVELLRLTQQNIKALQQIQEQTALMHQQFLQNQDKALHTFQQIAGQQQHLLLAALGREASAAPLPLPEIREAAPVLMKEPPPAASQEAAPAGDFGKLLLEVISEKTGYPVEMLEPGMSLDADLGIDSIKRVEIFSALKERYPAMPGLRSDEMARMKTPGDIIKHMSTSGNPGTLRPFDNPRGGGIAESLLSIIAEKTGYPAEMLDLDMSLDSDLGIDSIKRVEIFSALREAHPDLPAIKSDEMAALKSLREIVLFLDARSVTFSPPPVQEKPGELLAALTDLIAEKTGYPAEMLEPSMSLEGDLGIDSIKRVEIFSALRERFPSMPAVKSDMMALMKTLSDIVAFLEGEAPRDEKPLQGPATEMPMPEPREEGEKQLKRLVLITQMLNGVSGREKLALQAGSEIWVTDDGSPFASSLAEILEAMGYRPHVEKIETLLRQGAPPSLGGLLIIAPSGATESNFLMKAFKVLKEASPALKESARERGSFFATVSRMDGCFGLGGMDLKGEPLSGGLAGLTKTVRHEWPQICCKAFDVPAHLHSSREVALELIEELFLKGPIEVGISPKGRCTLELSLTGRNGTGCVPPFSRDDVVIVTGGARGVTAECAVQLINRLSHDEKPALVLLGRSPEPKPEPEWLGGLTGDAEIKRALMVHSGGKATPASIREEYGRIEAQREIASTLSRIREAGGRVFYRSVDIRNPGELRAAVEDIRATAGPIRGLVHGAGVIADRLIEDKTDEEFERVYSTKVEGLRNLLALLSDDELKILVLFSSFTGRFGRVGQADYAVANEVLNKLALWQSRLRPRCRVVALNWGPWDGGMVTTSLKKIFEKEGVGLIALEQGTEIFIRELCSSPDAPVEVVILGSDTGTGCAPAEYTTAFESLLTIEAFPFLNSHILDGQAVLPVAMMLEWLSHGALVANPGLTFYGADNLRVLKGLRIIKSESRTIRVVTGKAKTAGDFFTVTAELQSDEKGTPPVIHARGEIVLAANIPKGERSLTGTDLPAYPFDREALYREFLFHGSDFQGIEKVEGSSAQGIRATARTAPKPSAWIKEPLRNRWITDPLVIDCSFQMMILWSFQKYQSGSLPCYAGSYRQFRSFPRGVVSIVIGITGGNEHKALATIEFVDQKGMLIARMKGYECTILPSLKKAFENNRLTQEAMR
ncbi:MAG: SDR family NAD(P)-dependent oxidoreductase [Candidatus Eremiobacteraeota bacterium]|nr:SDR family NAD(P)-dependent oxidoreductase [Candidatus Eremiobacteraeota bacterium]